MTAPDLTAIVESVARELADDWNPDRDPILTAMFRDYADTAVRATLTAIMPLADGWEDMAEKNDRLGMSRIERAEAAAVEGDKSTEATQYEYARQAFGSRDAHKSCARELRGVLG